jgi:type II secretory ATPase GspE/PulE/Tfp pilus assembly ATPase PilB-like protein
VRAGLEKILEASPSVAALRALPGKAARTYQAMPLEWIGGELKIAVADTEDMDLLLNLHVLAGAPVRLVAADPASLDKMIAAHYQEGDKDAYVDFTASSSRKGSGNPVIRLVNEVISEAIHAGSSDIHFEPFEHGMQIRLRQDGMLRPYRTLEPGAMAEAVSRLKIMASLDIAEKRRPQDGRIRMEGAGQGIDLRVSTLPTDHGEKVVLRILDKGAVPLDLARLGLDPERQARLEQALRLPYGMILMTGPTGAGKTTTLYSCLNLIKAPEINIVTVEDPIEYKLDGITQTAVKAEVKYTFANALRTILRQDPNVIMVGEIRDRETAEIAVRAALTGHLVLTTLHANDAPGAVTRLLDMGLEPFLLASAMTLIGAQRLVRRLCPHCSAAGARGKGCQHCNRTGYSGRVGLFELLPVTDAIRGAITEKKDAAFIRELARKEGMLGLREDGEAKAGAGMTTLEEVLRETA